MNLAEFKVLLYNLKCSLCDWQDFKLMPSEKITKSPNFNPSQNFYSYNSSFSLKTILTCIAYKKEMRKLMKKQVDSSLSKNQALIS